MKRNLKRLKWALGLGLVGLGCIAAVTKYVSAHEDYEQFLANLNDLEGVKIGDSQDELLYSLGKPYLVRNADYDPKKPDAEDSKIHLPGVDIPVGKSVNDYSIWEWNGNGATVTARFDPKTKKVNRLNCTAGVDAEATQLVCTTVSLVSLGRDNNLMGPFYRRSENYIVDHLGKPDREQFSTVGEINRKILTYDELGLDFVLIGRQAVNIYKYESNPTFMWWMLHGPKLPVL
ncbi:hypothetical protein TomMM35A_20090 [Sphingobium sp. TomMM35A]